ncbi:MAG: flagellar basal body-associated FliL family protein [Bacteriovoracaceae bacterium]
MAEEEKQNAGQADAEGPAKSQKSPLVALLLVINTVGLAVVAFFQYQFMQMEAKRPDLNELLKQASGSNNNELIVEDRPIETISSESLVNLETFTVNLAQGDGPRRYVRLNAVLKLDEGSEIAEVEARKPQIRDTIIGILNSKRPEDILKRDGKLYLKEQIKSAINSFLIDGKVVDIFYVGFQIN